MPYVGKSEELDLDAAGEIEEAVLDVIKGKDPSLIAYALLRIVLIYWKLGGVTREQAQEVLLANAEAYFKERTH